MAFSVLEPQSSIGEETVSFGLLDSVPSILHIKLTEDRLEHGRLMLHFFKHSFLLNTTLLVDIQKDEHS